jgi:hypothetical protein
MDELLSGVMIVWSLLMTLCIVGLQLRVRQLQRDLDRQRKTRFAS